MPPVGIALFGSFWAHFVEKTCRYFEFCIYLPLYHFDHQKKTSRRNPSQTLSPDSIAAFFTNDFHQLYARVTSPKSLHYRILQLLFSSSFTFRLRCHPSSLRPSFPFFLRLYLPLSLGQTIRSLNNTKTALIT